MEEGWRRIQNSDTKLKRQRSRLWMDCNCFIGFWWCVPNNNICIIA